MWRVKGSMGLFEKGRQRAAQQQWWTEAEAGVRGWRHPTYGGRRERRAGKRMCLPIHPRQRATNP